MAANQMAANSMVGGGDRVVNMEGGKRSEVIIVNDPKRRWTQPEIIGEKEGDSPMSESGHNDGFD